MKNVFVFIGLFVNVSLEEFDKVSKNVEGLLLKLMIFLVLLFKV